MSTVTPASPKARSQEKFSFDKAVFGGVSLLTLQGTLDEGFIGRKIAESIKTKKIVINMRNVHRFASWGMSEWMDFLRINAERDIYLVECSPYALSQINLVTGLLGHAKLVSFYAAYRCGSCSEESEALLLTPRDREQIRELPTSQVECRTCGGRARLEEYAASFFDRIADRPPFDIDDEALAFFRSHLKYDLMPDLTRFRAFRKLQGGYTYLRLSGGVATLPPEVLVAVSEGTTVVDLANIVFDPTELTAWRVFVQGALGKLKSLQLLDCPPGFLEYALAPEDLREKLKVRTFVLPYDCLRCETRAAYMVDVAENLEQLAAGTAPAAYCPACQSQLVPVLTGDQVAFMRFLPARDRDPALDKFLAAARAEPLEKLENCLTGGVGRPAAPQASSRRALYVALALSVLVIGALSGVAFVLWKKRTEPEVATNGPAGGAGGTAGGAATGSAQPPKPAVERPEWILSDVPSSAYCHDLVNRLMCVGVSSYRPTREEAVVEANDAALDELVSAVGLKVTDAYFRESIMTPYSAARSKAISALQSAELEGGNAADTAAGKAVAETRKRVAEILRASGGPAVPMQRTDWYWEEYAAKKGGTEALVFVRYDVSLDAIRSLVEKYSAPVQVLGSTALTAFPGLAWKQPAFPGGALFTKVAAPLSGAGITPSSVVTAVGDQRVMDAVVLAKRLDEWKQAGGGDLKLAVQPAEGAARTVDLRQH